MYVCVCDYEKKEEDKKEEEDEEEPILNDYILLPL